MTEAESADANHETDAGRESPKEEASDDLEQRVRVQFKESNVASNSKNKNYRSQSSTKYNSNEEVAQGDSTENNDDRYGRVLRFQTRYSSSESNDAGYSKTNEKVLKFRSKNNRSNEHSIDSRSKNTKYKFDTHAGAENRKTKDGAVAIIYFQDPQTGRTFFYLEENDEEYAVVDYRNKLRFIGGSVETKDSSRYFALRREIGEEVESKKAQEVLLANLSPRLYAQIQEYVDGEIAETDVYIIKLNSAKEWEAVSSSRLTHDAGYARIVSLDEILTKDNVAFAFDQGPIIKHFGSHLIHNHFGHHMNDYSNAANMNYPAIEPNQEIKPLKFKIAA